MGQIEIATILEKNYPDWLDYKAIMELAGLPKANVIRNIKKVGRRTECEVRVRMGKVGWRTEYRMKQ